MWNWLWYELTHCVTAEGKFQLNHLLLMYLNGINSTQSLASGPGYMCEPRLM
jgi:hypothetical protein